MSSEPPAFGSLRSAAELVGATGGLESTRVRSSALTVRIALDGCPQTRRAEARISALAGDLLQMAVDASEDEGTPGCCIPRIRVRGNGARVDVDLHVERSDARGQAFLELGAQAVLPLLERLTECQSPATLQLFSTPVYQITIQGCVQIHELIDSVMQSAGPADGSAPRDCIEERVRLFCSGSHQPEFAARHNEHVFAEVSAAFGRDDDAGRFLREAAAHAVRWGSCEPLANWRRRGRELVGELQLPMLFDGGDIVSRTARRRAPASKAGSPLSEPSAGDPLVDIGCVALAASLGFLQRNLMGERPPRRRTLLPPPLPANGTLHRPGAGAADERRLESGIRPALRDSDLLRVRAGSDRR